MTPWLPERGATAGTLPAALLLVLGLCHSAQAHEGGLGNEVMWKACNAHRVNDRCAFENPHHDVYRGTCQSISRALVCVRNQPIDYANGSDHAPDPGHASTTASRLRSAASSDQTERTGRRWPWIVGYSVALLGALTAFRPKKAPGH